MGYAQAAAQRESRASTPILLASSAEFPITICNIILRLRRRLPITSACVSSSKQKLSLVEQGSSKIVASHGNTATCMCVTATEYVAARRHRRGGSDETRGGWKDFRLLYSGKYSSERDGELAECLKEGRSLATSGSTRRGEQNLERGMASSAVQLRLTPRCMVHSTPQRP